MSDPVLETERLQLRPLQPGDAQAIARYAGDRRIAANTLSIPHPYSLDMARDFIAYAQRSAADGSDLVFALLRKPQRELVGIIGLRPQAGRVAEIGYWTGVPFQGRGYMTEALRAVIGHAFGELGLRRVFASHFAGNPASGRVMQKAGMRYEARLRQHVVRWGQAHDLLVYGLLRDEYPAEGGR